MKRIRYYFLFLPFVLDAQSYPPPSSLITLPTAGTLQRGSVALTDRFQLGISYGSANLIGDDSLIWYPKPETNLKYLLGYLKSDKIHTDDKKFIITFDQMGNDINQLEL